MNPIVAGWFRGVGMPPGGATGQYPVKASNADFDFAWADAGSGGPVSWSSITSKPTTLAGFGITDAATAAQGALAATAVQPAALAAGLATKADAAATAAALDAVNGRLVGFTRIEAVTEYPVPEESGVLYILVGAP